MTDDTRTLEHHALDSFDVEGRWCTPCSCGQRFTGASPSTAFGRWSKHAEKQQSATPPLPPDGIRTQTPARVRTCGCGCGQPLVPRAGGLFRSGHDARFKSALTVAHAAGVPVRHPETGQQADAISVADWLDERRGGGTFWHDKVLAGHKPVPQRSPRSGSAAPTRVRGAAFADKVMAEQAARRPASGDIGTVRVRSGQVYGAYVLGRNNDTSLRVRLLDGPGRNEAVVIPDDRFTRSGR